MFAIRIITIFFLLSTTMSCKHSPCCVSKKKIALCTVATGIYAQEALEMIQSARENFLKGFDITFFVFTDQDLPSAPDIVIIREPQREWPWPVLRRYHAYEQNRNALYSMDYIYAIDADARFIEPVGEEVLTKRVATRGFLAERKNEDDRRSTAYIKKGDEKNYFWGSFLGGERREFFNMVCKIRARIDRDLSWDHIAIWYDESYLNRYLLDHPPKVCVDTIYCHHLPSLAGNHPKIMIHKQTH